MSSDITIRRLTTHEEFAEAEDVQRAAWGMQGDSALVPAHLLITAEHNGGLVLGAFTPDGVMAGFLFGFIGSTADQRAAWMHTPYLHVSHMMGVRPEYQHKSIGYALKCAQRRYVLEQGVALVVWTFDPLMSVNARLNVGRLGVVCCRYIPNLYGEIEEELNKGLPTDRFEVDWWIASPYVQSRIENPGPSISPSGWRMMGAQPINETGGWREGLRVPGAWSKHAAEPTLMVEIPADFQAIRRADMALAADWRQHTRELFQWAFGQGYVVRWFATEGAGANRRSYYILNVYDTRNLAEGRD